MYVQWVCTPLTFFATSWSNWRLTWCFIAVLTRSSGICRRYCKHVFPGQTTYKRLGFSLLPMVADLRSIATAAILPNDDAIIRSKIIPSVKTENHFIICTTRLPHKLGLKKQNQGLITSVSAFTCVKQNFFNFLCSILMLQIPSCHVPISDGSRAGIWGGGSEIRGRHKVFSCLKKTTIHATIVGYHTKVVAFSMPRKWLSFLVQLWDLRKLPQLKIDFYH